MNRREPRIFVPDGFRDKSGLYLPTELPTFSSGAELPPGLEPRIDLIVAGRLPAFVDQVFAYVTEEELKFDAMPPERIVAITQALPFWPSMLFLSRFQRDLWYVREDQAAQIALLHQWFGGSDFAARAEPWVKREPQRVLFSDQQIFALQRLLTLNARDGDPAATLTEQEYIALMAAVVAVPGSLLNLGVDFVDEPAPVEDEQWLRFFVGHGGFVGRGSLRNAFGRASRLYDELATSPDALKHHAWCPLEDWLVAEYGLGFNELQGFALALHAGSKMLDTDELPTLLDESYLSSTLLADKAAAGLKALSETRAWYAERFAKTQADPRRAVFEITPFLQRPALRLPNGKVMPFSPSALEAWMGATGNYYRYFDLARGKGDATRNLFTNFNGWLVETYARETAERAYPPRPESSMWLPGAVHGDHVYPVKGGESRTPDIAIDLTPDLILIEVTASRLTEKALVEADPEAVRIDIQKVLTDKIAQLGNRIRDLRGSVATLPELRIDQIDHIWPIVISSDGLFQTPTLWAHIRPTVDAALDQPKVQPLTLFDLEDLEEFMGLILSGASAIDILRDKTSELWRERELSAWFRGSGIRRYPDASPLAQEQFLAGSDRVARVLFGDEVVDERSAARDEQKLKPS